MAVAIDNAAPATKAFTITPSDTDNLSTATRGVLCNTSGNLVCLFANDTTAVTIPVTANVVYPFRLKRVNATGHTAGTVIGLA